MYLTPHAEARRAEFGLWEDEVAAVLDDPETVWENATPSRVGNRRDCAVYTRGSWAVVVRMREPDGEPDGQTVVTILRRQYDRWEHE